MVQKLLEYTFPSKIKKKQPSLNMYTQCYKEADISYLSQLTLTLF